MIKHPTKWEGKYEIVSVKVSLSKSPWFQKRNVTTIRYAKEYIKNHFIFGIARKQ